MQRVTCRIILKENYTSYDQALEILKLQNLSERRTMLASRFAQKCTKHERFENLFPKNNNQVNLRNKQEYEVKFATTQKLYKSSIPAMQRLLNSKNQTK